MAQQCGNKVPACTAPAAGLCFIRQYPPGLAAQWESLATWPDDLLLFFHSVPYDQKLPSGESLRRSVDDQHCAGACGS